MIVKNEERCLERCLLSIKDCVDEIIIVDTGSTDKTREIALRYVDDIYFFEWNNNFSDARNFSIDKATKDWILIIDADEWVDSNTIDKLQEWKKQSHEWYNCFRIWSKDLIDESNPDYYQKYHSPRIFKNNGTFKYTSAVHNQLINIHDDARLGDLKLEIWHDGYLVKVRNKQNKLERTHNLLLEELEKDPYNAFHNYNIGATYTWKHDYEKALEHFLRAYEYGVDSNWHSNCFVRILSTFNCLEKYKEGLKFIEEYESEYPEFYDLMHVKGDMLKKLGYYYDAINVYEDILKLKDNKKYEYIMELDYNIAYEKLGDTYLFSLGKDLEALKFYIEGLRINNNNVSILNKVIFILSKHYNEKEVIDFMYKTNIYLINNSQMLNRYLAVLIKNNNKYGLNKIINELKRENNNINIDDIKNLELYLDILDKDYGSVLSKFQYNKKMFEDLFWGIILICIKENKSIFDCFNKEMIENLGIDYNLINKLNDLFIDENNNISFEEEEFVHLEILINLTLNLQEYDVFENIIYSTNFKEKSIIKLNDSLSKYKQYEIAIDILANYINSQIFSENVFDSFIVTLIRSNNLDLLEDTLKQYLKEDKKKFKYYLYLLEVLEKKGNADELILYGEEAIANFQDCNWLIEKLKEYGSSHSKLNKIVFFAAPEDSNSIDNIFNYCADIYNAKKIIIYNLNQISQHINWADTCFVSWNEEIIYNLTNIEESKNKKIVCILKKLKEVNITHDIKWNVIDSILFENEDIKEKFLDKYLGNYNKNIKVISDDEIKENINKYIFKDINQIMNKENYADDYDYLIKNQIDMIDEIYNLVDSDYIYKAEPLIKKYIDLLSIENNLLKKLSNQNLDEDLLQELEKLYKILTNKYIEVYSIKAVIAINENKLEDAESFLKEGLKLNEDDFDTNYNLAYVYQLKNDNKNSMQFYKKAYEICNDNEMKANIKEILENNGIDLNRRKAYSDVEDNYCNKIMNAELQDNIHNRKILHGTMEIANQMHTLTEGLRNMNIHARSLNHYNNYLGYKSDYYVDLQQYKNINEANKDLKNTALKYMSEFDIFHFHFGTSLTLDYSDLHVLKEFDKKVVMNHWGSDVRMYSKAKEMNHYANVKDMDEEGIKRKLNFLSKHISHCIVADYELYEYVKNYYENVHIVPQAIDINKYNPIIKEDEKCNKKMLIVHAPTSPEIKGTQYILKAIEELKLKYNFDFKLIQGMSHDEAKKIYQKADLIIDQILIGGYGLLAIEAMAMEKPVICWISDYMKEKYPREIPIICANPENIKEKIEYAIKNKELLQVIGRKGRKYIKSYHDSNKVCSQLIKIYESI